MMRAAQSKGKVDLLALWPYHYVLGMNGWAVQCKRDGRLPAAERQALLDLYRETWAIPILAKAGPNGRGVEFIDLREEKS